MNDLDELSNLIDQFDTKHSIFTTGMPSQFKENFKSIVERVQGLPILADWGGRHLSAPRPDSMVYPLGRIQPCRRDRTSRPQHGSIQCIIEVPTATPSPPRETGRLHRMSLL